MKTKKILWITLYIVALVLPSYLYVKDTLTFNNEFIFVFTGVIGIVSYTLLCFQFLLTSRPKPIDNVFGLDKLYRFHMMIAVLALILGFSHKLLKGLYYGDSLQTQFGDIGLFSFIGLSVLGILLMVNKLLFNVKPVQWIRSMLQKYLPFTHEIKVWMHNLTLISLGVVFVHVLLASSVSFNIPLKVVMIAYFVFPLVLYFNHKIIKRFMNDRNRFIIKEIIREDATIHTIVLLPKKGKVFNYLPGQFLYMTVLNGAVSKSEHPFTISSSPLERDYITVTIKNAGDFTGNLHLLKGGEEVFVDGPYGTFSYVKKAQKDALTFIAGGIGITPFLGMLRHMAKQAPHQEVQLLWGVRNEADLIFEEELRTIQNHMPNFTFVPIVSHDPEFLGEKGVIDYKRITKYVPEIQINDFYLCGPPIMLDTVLKQLQQLSINKSQIHFERFSM